MTKKGIAICVLLFLTYSLASDSLWAEPCRTQATSGESCSTCTCLGGCDEASERNLWGPDKLIAPNLLTIRLRLILFAEDNGQSPSVAPEKVIAQIDKLNEDFEPAGIQFSVETAVEWDSCFRHMCDPEYEHLCETKTYCCDPPEPGPICCESNGPQLGCDYEDYQEVIMKNTYAENPDQALHVYVPGSGNGDWAVYPWSELSDTVGGGAMVMAHTVGGSTCGLSGTEDCIWCTHEVGHALGLWHTFDTPPGDPEGDCPCVETAICTGSEECTFCDHVGDLCCDTPSGLGAGGGSCGSTNGNDYCSNNAAYPPVDYTNFMDYGGDGCANHFTINQAQRMHCWVCNRLPGWIDSPDCNENEIPDVCEITRGDKDDCDENGVPDDCQPDCNSNDVADVCDISSEHSDDCDENGVPDECQSSHMPQRACCYDGDQCMVTTECHCDELSGTFVSGQTSCLYGPCAMFGP